MKLSGTWILMGMLGWATGTTCAQLVLAPDPQPQCVFGGGARNMNLVWRNAGDNTTNVEIRARIFQASSATVAPVGGVAWKKLPVLPQQTVLESAPLDFPVVKAKTRFLVEWITGTNQIIGKTEVLVYPTNLLGELKPLLDGKILGVLDPDDEIKPLLKQNGVEFLNLEEMALEDFRGRLAIIGPFHSGAQMRKGLTQTIPKIAAAGVTVVWLQPAPDPGEQLVPSFYIVQENNAAIVIVQADLVSHFSENPKSQLNLVQFCKLALNPEPFWIPHSLYQP